MKRTPLFLFVLALVVALPVFAAPEYPQMGEDIYDTKANGSEQIAAALARAERSHKRVLVMFGANWCVWCHRLHATFASDAAVAKALGENFEVVLIDVNTRNHINRNDDVDVRYGRPTKLGLPVLVVLEADGKPLTTQDSGELERGEGHDPKKILSFLARWTPPKP